MLVRFPTAGMLALLASLLCCGHVGAPQSPRAFTPVLLPECSPVTFQYEHGSSVHAFFRDNPGAELAHWREGQRSCANSAQFDMTGSFFVMAHSSDDDDDDNYSQPSEEEDGDYFNYIKISSTPGQQRHAPDGGATQDHERGTSKTQAETRRASSSKTISASGSHSHVSGKFNYGPYDANLLIPLHKMQAKKRTKADQKISSGAGAGSGADPPLAKRNRKAASYSTARSYRFAKDPEKVNFKRNKAGSNQHSADKETQAKLFTTETGTSAVWARLARAVWRLFVIFSVSQVGVAYALHRPTYL
jgi:hypothetical protein